MPYPSTLHAVWEYRLQALLDEAARERLAAAAVPSRLRQKGVMFGMDHDDSIVQRGIDAALACQDMLPRAPVMPFRRTRIVARLAALARRKPAVGQQRNPSVPQGTPSR